MLQRVFSLILLASAVWAQSTDAVVSGNVLDPAGASIPGANITALNVNTGVSTSVSSNASGVYQFSALPPGVYRFSAEKQGFKRLNLNETTLRVSDHLQQNLVLQLGGVNETVEVAANSDSVNYLTSSQGGTLNSSRIQNLPTSDRNALELVGTQAGLISTSSGANINGARADFLNVTLDGVNIMDNAVLTSVTGQLISTTVDRIEEVRVITSPVDAEYGRGSGQVQLISRSGTNRFHGSVYDFAHNTALNANTWSNNRSGVARNVDILNQTGARLDGPIRKNKTFFFGLFEASIDRTKSSVTNTVLTDSARDGIFRFYPGVQNGNANSNNPSVDLAGNPVAPRGATGALQTVSLFGRDPNRMTADTGGVAKTLALLPRPNSFLSGDGLNTAGYIWRRGASDDLYSVDFRVDHNFNQAHRLTLSYNRDYEDNPNGNDAQVYPTSPGGAYVQTSTVGSAAFVSVLSPSVVNEARIGIQRVRKEFKAPWTSNPDGTGILPSLNGIPYILSLNGITSPLAASDPQGRITPVYQYSDKISWLHGKHALKAGVELRFLSEYSYHAFNVIPRVTLGAGNVGVQNINTISGIGANATLASNLLTTLSGSVGSLVEQFYASGGTNPTYAPFNNEEHWNRLREWGAYIQDDFKVRKNLVLNLGLRWEYYGVPQENQGRMVDLVGGSSSIFGISGNNFGALFQPGNMPGSLTQFQLIGANSPHPDVLPWAKRFRNFAPAIGLSWSLPWFGANKTVFRAGYAISYEHNIMALLNQLFGYGAPGLGQQQSITSSTYQSLNTISLPLPLPAIAPLATIPINDNNSSAQSVNVPDDHLKQPYIQNWNASLGREIAKGVVLDVRYVGSKGTRLIQGISVNEVNIFENGILDAFNTTMAGGNSALLNQIFKGLNIPQVGVVDGVNITGSQAVRQNTTLQAYLLNNNVAGFANFLGYNTFVTGVRGGLLKNGGLPANFVVANPQFGTAALMANISNSTYHSLQIEVNKRFQNGFQVQASYVRSKALGSYDGNTQNEIENVRTLRDLSLSKQLLSFDRPNVWKISGVWDLPFGPGKALLNRRGALGRLLEQWQTAVIFNRQSGTPTNFGLSSNAGGTYNNVTATPDILGAIPGGSVHTSGNNVVYFNGLTQVPDPSVGNLPANLRSLSTLLAIQGADGQILVRNPTPGSLGSSSPTAYRGLGSFTLNLQLSKSLTFNPGRAFFGISRDHPVTLRLRADAINLLNTPIWSTPNLNIDSTSFGVITSASGNRNIVLGARIEF